MPSPRDHSLLRIQALMELTMGFSMLDKATSSKTSKLPHRVQDNSSSSYCFNNSNSKLKTR